MTPTPLKTVSPDAEVSEAVALMAQSGLHQLPVIQANHVVGLLGRGDIVRFLQLRQELHLRLQDVSHDGGAQPAPGITRG